MDQGEWRNESVVKIRAPGSGCIDPGAFFIAVRVGTVLVALKEIEMDRKELAYAKQTVCAVKDWDAFQAVIRSLARILSSLAEIPRPVEVKKN